MAKADDPSAIYYNPAGLSKQEGVGIEVGAHLLDLNYKFQPADDKITAGRETRSFESMTQKEGWQAVPMVFAHFDFDALKDWDFGAGIYGPATVPHRRYNNQFMVKSVMRGESDVTDSVRGDQQRSLVPNGMIVDEDVLLMFPTLSVAYRILPELSVGVSLQAAMFTGDMSIAIGGAVPGVVSLDVSDWFTPTAVIGVAYEPLRSVQLGLSLRPPFELDAQGSARITRFYGNTPTGREYGENEQIPLGPWELNDDLVLYDANGKKEDGVHMKLHDPLMLRAGVRYVNLRADGSERFDIEFDYMWEMQEMHDSIEVSFDAKTTQVPADEGNGYIEVDLPRMNDKRNYRNTHSFRLGGDWNVIPELLTLRLGGNYEISQSPEENTHLDFISNDRWGVAAGVGVHLGMFELNFAYSYVGLIERDVTDSDVRLVDITSERDKYDENGVRQTGWKVNGNGQFEGSLHVLALSLGIYL